MKVKPLATLILDNAIDQVEDRRRGDVVRTYTTTHFNRYRQPYRRSSQSPLVTVSQVAVQTRVNPQVTDDRVRSVVGQACATP
jgi:hypothetical protein